MPFQRLDAARGGSGHCGLGLAIATRVAAAHGGGLERLESDSCGNGPSPTLGFRFGIVLWGSSKSQAGS